MTGRDPAIEAAHKVLDQLPHRSPSDVDLIAAAREALKPIREWFPRKYAEALEEDLYDNRDLLKELAPLIYSDDELRATP